MKLFRSRHSRSDEWHRNITQLAGEVTPIRPYHEIYDQPAALAWQELQCATSTYLKKKKLVGHQIAVNKRLLELIEGHVPKYIAVAACSHQLSSQALLDLLLGELQPELHTDDGLANYLQSVVAASFGM